MIRRLVPATLWLLLLLNGGLIAAAIALDHHEALGRGVMGAFAALACLMVWSWLR